MKFMGFKDLFKIKEEKSIRKTKKKAPQNSENLNKLAEEIKKESKDIHFEDKLMLGYLIYQEIYFKNYPEKEEKLRKDEKEWKRYKEILKKTDQIQEYKSWESLNKDKIKYENNLKKKYPKLLEKLREYSKLTKYIPPKNKEVNYSKLLPPKFLEISSWEIQEGKDKKKFFDKTEKESWDFELKEEEIEDIDIENLDNLFYDAEKERIKRKVQEEKEKGKILEGKLLKNKVKCDFCKKQIIRLKDLAIEKEKIYCLGCWNELRKESYEKEREEEWKKIKKEETEKFKKRGLTQKEINWYFRDSEDKIKMMFDLVTKSRVEGELDNKFNESNLNEAIKIIQKRKKKLNE